MKGMLPQKYRTEKEELRAIYLGEQDVNAEVIEKFTLKKLDQAIGRIIYKKSLRYDKK